MHSLDDESIANASLVRCTVKVVLCIRLFAECKAVPGERVQFILSCPLFSHPALHTFWSACLFTGFEMVVRPIEHAAPRLAVVAVLAGVSALVLAHGSHSAPPFQAVTLTTALVVCALGVRSHIRTALWRIRHHPQAR
jgi:hypothetical protein